MEKTYKLGEICKICSGKTPDTKKKEYWCSHEEKCDCINWYTGKDITQGNLETGRKITLLAVKENNQPLTTANSILFFHMECLPFYSGISGFSCNQIISVLEPNLNLVIPNYLYYYLSTNQKKLRTLRTGTAQLFTKQSSLTYFPISLSSLQEQNQILQKFQIVYDKLFKSEIVYNNRLLEIVKTILEYADLLFLKYKDSQIKIKDHFKLVRGKTPPTKNPEYYENGTIKWINSGVLTNLYFLTEYTKPSKLVTEKAVKECKLFYAQPNTVLFSDIDLSPKKIVWVMEQKNEDWETDGTHVWTLLGTDVYENSALFFALRQINFSTYASGSIINHLQGSALLNMKIDWVSDPEKQKITELKVDILLEREEAEEMQKRMDDFYRQNPPREDLVLQNILGGISNDYLLTNQENKQLKAEIQGLRKQLEVTNKVIEKEYKTQIEFPPKGNN